MADNKTNTTSDPSGMGPLFEALARAQGKVRGAEKDAINPHFKSRYSTLASIWEACREALSSEGLAVVQTFDVDSGVALMVTILGHKSGAMLTGRYPLNAIKADPQSMAAAATYARRVALAAMVGVAPEDDDGETASGRGQSASAPRQAEAPGQRAEAPVQAKPPADPLTDMDILQLSDLAKSAGFKTRGDLLPLLKDFGGGASALKLMDRAHLPELITELKRLAGPRAPTEGEIDEDVAEMFGPETGE